MSDVREPGAPERLLQVVLATNNAHKLTEMRRMLAEADLGVEVLGLSDLVAYPEPAETETTFDGNALLKARECVARSGLAAMADDSGLAVDALNGMPGVRSARWSGPDATDASNNALLLAQLHDVPDERRAARFVCSMALVLPANLELGGGTERLTNGVMPGRLLHELRGSNGFGYDPMFVPDGDHRSYAELTAAQKDAISHRGQAVRLMVGVLAELLRPVGTDQPDPVN